MVSSTEKLKKLLMESKNKKRDITIDEIIKTRLKKDEIVPNKEILKKPVIKKNDNSSLEDIENILSKENRFSYEFNKHVLNKFTGNILVNCDSSNNRDLIIQVIKKSLSENKVPILILTSTNYKTMSSLLMESKISLNSVYLIDTVSKNLININDFNKVFFIDSLRNLTQLEITLFKILKTEKKSVVIFDTVDVLEFYHLDKLILKFVYSIVKLIQKKSSQSVFIINNSKLAPKLAQFFTDFVEVKKID